MVKALLVIFPFPSCQLPQNLSGHHISETSTLLSQTCLKSTQVFENELREEEEDLNILSRTYSLKIRLTICFLSTVKSGKISRIGVRTKSFLVFGTVPLFEECRSYTNLYNLNQQKHNDIFFLGVLAKQLSQMFQFLFSCILQDRYFHRFTFYRLGLLFFFFLLPGNVSVCYALKHKALTAF